jgi:hypothetical protein
MITDRHTEQRRHFRTITSVLSEVFVLEGTSPRYLGPGVVLDMSESGLGLALDNPPQAATQLLIKNTYFDVDARIVNRTAERGSTRLGLQFTSDVRWNRTLDTPVLPQPAAPAPPAGPAARTAPSMWYQRYNLYRKFLDVLALARKKLPAAILRLDGPQPGDSALRYYREYSVHVGELMPSTKGSLTVSTRLQLPQPANGSRCFRCWMRSSWR